MASHVIGSLMVTDSLLSDEQLALLDAAEIWTIRTLEVLEPPEPQPVRTVWEEFTPVLPITPPEPWFATIEEALAAHTRPTRMYVRIGGVVVDATEVNIQHGYRQPVATCTVYCAAPVPESAAWQATVEVELGYPGATARRFFGTIPRKGVRTDGSGNRCRIEAVGELSRLTTKHRQTIELDGDGTLEQAFYSLSLAAGVPNFASDKTTYVDGVTPIAIGGNPQINDGQVRIEPTTSPLDWGTRFASMFGYYWFDNPDGMPRQRRISGRARPQLAEPLLTTALSADDYVQVRTSLNFREEPDTSAAVIAVLDADLIGHLVSSEQVSADGFLWMQMTFPDQPIGWSAIHNTEGTPNFYRLTPETVPFRYAYGVNCYSIETDDTTDDIVTYWEVKGARYTSDDGGPVQIRSIPDEVPELDILPEPYYRADSISSQDIVTEQQAEGWRNVLELDRGNVAHFVRWECAGHPGLQIGDIVRLHSPLHEIVDEDYFLTHITESHTSTGYRAQMEGYRGTGEALEAGNDCTIVSLSGGVIHVGNQTLSHYADPTADGITYTIPIVVTDDGYSSARLLAEGHGSNSYGEKTASTGSKIEVWQLEDPTLPESGSNELKRVGSTDLPTLDEEISRRRPYATDDRYWSDVSLPLPGSLAAGAAEVRFISGENPDGQDDFELRDLRLQLCGVGQPQLPGGV